MNIILAGAAVSILSSCNGIFSDIYDEADTNMETSGFGFITPSTPTSPGTIYIDATSYTDWVYLDFTSLQATTLPVDAPAPAQWDIAVHRYDAKTNGASVAATSLTSFSQTAGLTSLQPSSFSTDIFTTDRIVTDMSTMMDGYLSYAESDYNPVLSLWLDVDKSTMPPVYTLSGKIYAVRMADGRTMALKLDNFMDASGVKGFLTIQYLEDAF